MAFGADVSTGGEGVFLRHNGQIRELGRTGGVAPGGGSFEFGFLGPVGLNDPGDMVFNFLLKDFAAAGWALTPALIATRTRHGKVTPVVIPFVTPAPDGGKFQGVSFQPTINNLGDEVFAGIVETDDGVHVVPDDGKPDGWNWHLSGRRQGSDFQRDRSGDAAPGRGRYFDYAVEPWVNDGGDVSFIGHIAGEESVVPGFPPQAEVISALGNLYVRKRGTGYDPHHRARG